MSAQVQMFGAVAQPRQTWPEPIQTYRAVLTLRSRGWKVWRVGMHDHRVGDRIVNTKQLMMLARYG